MRIRRIVGLTIGIFSLSLAACDDPDDILPTPPGDAATAVSDASDAKASDATRERSTNDEASNDEASPSDAGAGDSATSGDEADH